MSHAPVLPGLFDTPQATPRRHKRQRQTARAVYHRQRAIDVARTEIGKPETRQAKVLRILSWFFTIHQHSPTALELLEWGRRQGESLFDVNSLRPRLTELTARGLVEPRTKRKCTVSGELVWTWAIREIGSKEAS